ncbi:MAG: hypothetical protein IKP73_13380 [Bacteroidales bacterium]|nr:hypothetical protein [Bacteroidales bacterium]
MELPSELLGDIVNEGELYFFMSDCPIGIADHIHVCIKHHNKVLMFSTCSSQIDTAIRVAMLRGYDINIFPVLLKNDTNKFRKPQTYINCNNVIEISSSDFGDLIKTGKIRKLDGVIDNIDMQLIAKGVKLSPDVPLRIKKLFD